MSPQSPLNPSVFFLGARIANLSGAGRPVARLRNRVLKSTGRWSTRGQVHRAPPVSLPGLLLSGVPSSKRQSVSREHGGAKAAGKSEGILSPTNNLDDPQSFREAS